MSLRKKVFWIVVISFFVLVIFSTCGSALLYRDFRQSPFYSLNQIEVALKNDDFEKFNEYVDIDSIAEQIYNYFVNNLPFENFFRPIAKEFIRNEIKKQVNEGNFDESAFPEQTFLENLNTYWDSTFDCDEELCQSGTLSFEIKHEQYSLGFDKKNKIWLLSELDESMLDQSFVKGL